MSLAPSDGSIYPKFDASNPDGFNFLGGFFAVPFSSDFDEYADSMIDNYIIHGAKNCMDNYLVTNVFNCRFNSGIKNCDIDAMDEAVKNGANISNIVIGHIHMQSSKPKQIQNIMKLLIGLLNTMHLYQKMVVNI